MPEASDDQHTSAAKPKQERDPRRVTLGKRIQEARRVRGCRSQALLAEVAGIGVRRLAGAEIGEEVSRATLAAIEAVFDWPANRTTDYLNGDDDALNDLPTRGPLIPNATRKQLADLGLTLDVAPEPDCVEWLRGLRAQLPREKFFQLVDQMTRPRKATQN